MLPCNIETIFHLFWLSYYNNRVILVITHTNAHYHLSIISSPKTAQTQTKKYFVKLNEKSRIFCLYKRNRILLLLVDLLLQMGHFFITNIHKYKIALIHNQFSKTAQTQKNGFVKFNENGKLCWHVKKMNILFWLSYYSENYISDITHTHKCTLALTHNLLPKPAYTQTQMVI